MFSAKTISDRICGLIYIARFANIIHLNLNRPTKIAVCAPGFSPKICEPFYTVLDKFGYRGKFLYGLDEFLVICLDKYSPEKGGRYWIRNDLQRPTIRLYITGLYSEFPLTLENIHNCRAMDKYIWTCSVWIVYNMSHDKFPIKLIIVCQVFNIYIQLMSYLFESSSWSLPCWSITLLNFW